MCRQYKQYTGFTVNTIKHLSDLKMIAKYYLLRLKISLRLWYVHVSTLIKEIGSNYHVQKLEAQWAEPVSLTFHSALRKLNTDPSIGASHQVSVHLAIAVSGKKIFRNRPIRNKNCLWRPCLQTDRDKINDLFGRSSIDASYQVSVQLAK
jgi:hypothetical protein